MFTPRILFIQPSHRSLWPWEEQRNPTDIRNQCTPKKKDVNRSNADEGGNLRGVVVMGVFADVEQFRKSQKEGEAVTDPQ
jgi:hypothetical protein